MYDQALENLCEEPCHHAGWMIFTFDIRGHSWRLITIDTATEQRSILSSNVKSNDPWPGFSSLGLPCVITPGAAGRIIHLAFNMHEFGIEVGDSRRAAKIRAALGVL